MPVDHKSARVAKVFLKKELDAIKKRSKSFMRGKGPWVDHELEMHKKTALKRLCKHLPKSSQYSKENTKKFA